MHRPFREARLLIATHNAGKLREIAALFRPYDIQIVEPKERNLVEPLETGSTFIENAELKARAAATSTGLVALADDSGLCVEALDGAPGVHSARWGGEGKDFSVAMHRVHDEVLARGSENPRAKLVCVLSLAWPDGHLESFSGDVSGTLIWPPRGTLGSGYEPMFVPDGHTQTFAEMPPAQKHAINARAHAFAQLAFGCLRSILSKTA